MDLSKLSSDAKRDIAKHLFLKKKVKEARQLDYWKPWVCRHGGIHTSQFQPFQSKARRRCIFGGNRSGKTEVAAADVVHMFLGTHPYRENRIPCIIKVFGEDFTTALAKAVIPKVLKFLPPSAIAEMKKSERGVITHIKGHNGSIIDFMSYDQDSTKFESFDCDMAWFDEPPPKPLYDGIRRGLIDRKGTELFSMTPLREPWIYNTFYVPWVEGALSDTEIFQIRSDCNPYIDLAELESLKEVYDEDTLKSRLEGKFKYLSGLVYKVELAIHKVPMFEWPIEWPIWMCIDPHPKKPHAVSWVGVTKYDQKVVLDEMKLAIPLSELAAKIKTLETERRYRVVDRLCDTSIKALDRTDQRKLLADAGIRCRFPAKHDRIIPGIEKVQSMLQIRKDHEGKEYAQLVFRENCKGHFKEIMSYIWDEAGEKPKKQEDDYMDNLRYICDVEPRFNFNPKPIHYTNGLY